MAKIDSSDFVRFTYNLLAKYMKPEALDQYIQAGLRTRGSRSVNGFMRMMADEHEAKQHRKHGTSISTSKRS
jgi:hypothetical protein